MIHTERLQNCDTIENTQFIFYKYTSVRKLKRLRRNGGIVPV